jgi:hypothetical protein
VVGERLRRSLAGSTGAEPAAGLIAGAVALLGVLAAVGLTGCVAPTRALPPHPTPGPAARRDVALLNEVLAAEQHTIAVYVAAVPVLGGTARRAAAAFLAHDLQHTGILRALITALGGVPRAAPQSADVGAPSGPSGLLARVERLERGQATAAEEAIAAVSSPHLRQALAALLADDAQHVAVLGALRSSARSRRSSPGAERRLLDVERRDFAALGHLRPASAGLRVARGMARAAAQAARLSWLAHPGEIERAVPDAVVPAGVTIQ